MNRLRILLFLINVILPATLLLAQKTGSLSGKIIDEKNNEPLSYVNVIIQNTGLGAATDISGNYKLNGIPAGKHNIIVSAVGYLRIEQEIEIEEGKETIINFKIHSTSIDVGEVVVYGASLRQERITEAPNAITVIEARDIQRFGSHGQIAKLLEMEPGIDVAQSGLFDFNINTRGFNSSLNRRVLVLLDGRDLGTAFLGATEWNGLSTPVEELGRIELVRGPGSALYGANAFNGVMNISSNKPKDVTGTRINLTAGESDSYRSDIRFSNSVGKLSYRTMLGGYQGRSFVTSRKNYNFEYAGLTALNNEQIDVNRDPIRSIYGSMRIDYEIDDKSFITGEGGYTQVENETIVTGIGRVQVQKASRPWLRFNYNGYGFNVMYWANGRNNIKPEKSLATGLNLIQDAWIHNAEVQYNFTGLDDKLFVVVGGSHRLVNIDTKGTLMLEPRNDNTSSLFTQVEYKFNNNFKTIGALRWDRSSLHDSEFSPKVALVYNFNPSHSLRLTYNQAFQAPNYSEQYLYVKSPPTIPPFTTSTVYTGKPDLITEKITGYEIGYKGIYFDNLFLTLDVYFNQLKDFITDLGPTGESIFENGIRYSVWSYGNAGKVDEYGFEVSANYYLSDNFVVDANYSYFGFDVIEKDENDYLLPNSPKYKINGGITYYHPEGHSLSVKVKYVPTFPWAAGIFRDGEVVEYTMINLGGTYIINSHLSFNLNVTNLLDKEHYEILGGSLLRRRALASLNITI
ncbi:MAG: TonB-dependent receptor [Ignavibacteriales bacterium]|nr:MAG: TonB-dependent receptor [Ignavibacteriales bacterium]